MTEGDESEVDMTDITDLSEDEETATETEEQTQEESSSSMPTRLGFAVLANSSGLETYLESLDSVLELEKYFLENKNFKSATNSLETLSSLISTGMARVLQYFNKVLNANLNHLELQEDNGKIKLIRRGADLLGGQGIDSFIQSNKKLLQLLDQYTISNLQKAIQRLQISRAEHRSHIYLETFVEKRAEFLLHTVQRNFNEHNVLRHVSPTDKKNYKSDRFTLNSLNPMKLLGNDDKEIREREFIEASAYTYERGTHRFLLLIRTLLILLRAERSLVESLIPQRPLHYFAKIVEPTFHYFGLLSEELLGFQKRTPNRIYGISVILDIYSVFKRLMPSYDTVLNKVDLSPEFTSITQFWAKITTSGRQIFQKLKEDVRNDPSRTIPTDANVHELTSKCFNFLTNLFNYKDSVMDLLPPMPSTSKVSPLGDYVIALIDSLKENLIIKTKREKKSVVAIVFLVNNFYFIWNNIKGSALEKEVGTSIVNMYKSWFEEQLEQYKLTLTKIQHILKNDDVKESKKEKGGLSKKYRAAIKSRFKGVNEELTDMFNEQGRFFIANEQLRKDMRAILVKNIVPQYQAFLARYSDVEFTKNPEKYIKIDLETLDSMLNKFFGGHLKGALKDTSVGTKESL